mmetsp:Transcript_4912/g.17531  ORF Transcript_4912/g.17531 Transcript_4912/m.17531 type:complete len:797 (+) Transcript_4912:4021-6411(+)
MEALVGNEGEVLGGHSDSNTSGGGSTLEGDVTVAREEDLLLRPDGGVGAHVGAGSALCVEAIDDNNVRIDGVVTASDHIERATTENDLRGIESDVRAGVDVEVGAVREPSVAVEVHSGTAEIDVTLARVDVNERSVSRGAKSEAATGSHSEGFSCAVRDSTSGVGDVTASIDRESSDCGRGDARGRNETDVTGAVEVVAIDREGVERVERETVVNVAHDSTVVLSRVQNVGDGGASDINPLSRVLARVQGGYRQGRVVEGVGVPREGHVASRGDGGGADGGQSCVRAVENDNAAARGGARESDRLGANDGEVVEEDVHVTACIERSLRRSDSGRHGANYVSKEVDLIHSVEVGLTLAVGVGVGESYGAVSDRVNVKISIVAVHNEHCRLRSGHAEVATSRELGRKRIKLADLLVVIGVKENEEVVRGAERNGPGLVDVEIGLEYGNVAVVGANCARGTILHEDIPHRELDVGSRKGGISTKTSDAHGFGRDLVLESNALSVAPARSLKQVISGEEHAVAVHVQVVPSSERHVVTFDINVRTVAVQGSNGSAVAAHVENLSLNGEDGSVYEHVGDRVNGDVSTGQRQLPVSNNVELLANILSHREREALLVADVDRASSGGTDVDLRVEREISRVGVDSVPGRITDNDIVGSEEKCTVGVDRRRALRPQVRVPLAVLGGGEVDKVGGGHVDGIGADPGGISCGEVDVPRARYEVDIAQGSQLRRASVGVNGILGSEGHVLLRNELNFLNGEHVHALGVELHSVASRGEVNLVHGVDGQSVVSVDADSIREGEDLDTA